MLCENCERKLYRSHRRGLVERLILPRMGIYPFRCVSCDARIYAYGRGRPDEIRGFRVAVMEKMDQHHWLSAGFTHKNRITDIKGGYQQSA